MSIKNTGGPAFPEVRIRNGDNYNPAKKLYYGGMTLRDYFAAKAMQGLLAQSCGSAMGSEPINGAQYAYAMADAMLKEREA